MTEPGLLHVVLSLNPGGTERLVIELVRRTRTSIPTAVCCLDEAGEWADEVIGLGVPVRALGRRPGFQPSLGRAVAAIAAETGSSVLHCHQYSPFVYGRLALLAARDLRLVYTEHGRNSDAPPSAKRRLVNPFLGRFRGPIVAVSHELEAYLAASGLPRRRIQVIHNGVEPGDVPGPDARVCARQLLGLSPEAFVVGTVARLDPVKDLGTLVSAFAKLAASHPAARLVIVGGGPERHAIEHYAEVLGVLDRISLTGPRRDVRTLLPAFDVYANSSLSEGISITILEAMAAALPVVATRVGGTPEVVVHDATGCLVPARDPDAFAGVLSVLARQPSTRRGFGTAGRDRIERCFTMDRMVERYVRLYRPPSA